MKLHEKFGEKWGQLGQELQRSGLGCRNRWRLLSRKASKVYYGAVNSQIPDLSDSQHIRTNPPQCVFQVDVLHQQPHWPPYYPPEAYSYLSPEEITTPDSGFREPTPEIVSHSPHEAPFNFSSSSLSAALSDPPRIPVALPPIVECDRLSSVAPSSPRHELPYHHQMSLDDLRSPSEEDQHQLALILSRPCFGTEGGAHYNTSLFSSLIDTTPTMDNDGWDNFPADFLSLPVCGPSSLQILDGLFTDPNFSDASSSLSTPSHFPTSLSAASSPNGGSPNELPVNDYRVVSPLPTDNRKQPPRRSFKKKPVKPQGPTRLSSMLALTPDPSVRPYACGREMCWPRDAPTSSACFATSKELLDHCKTIHVKDPSGDKPFKCALAGCGKSWKSLNGLQYHLQLSTAHFRNALSTTFSSQRTAINTQPRSSSTPGSGTDVESGDETKRTYFCHHPGCFKAYRQPSGLRYHLKHGHPTVLPIQLSVVPPALARQMPSKTKKMRRKVSTEEDS